MTPEVIKVLAAQGAGLAALVMVLWFARQSLGPFLDAQRAQAAAMQAQADAMRDMKDAVSSYVARDNDDHREILLSLQVMAKEVKQLSEIVRSQNSKVPADDAGVERLTA